MNNKRSGEQAVLAIIAVALLIFGMWYGARGVSTQSKGYTIYRLNHEGWSTCVYLFGITSTALTNFSLNVGRATKCEELVRVD